MADSLDRLMKSRKFKIGVEECQIQLLLVHFCCLMFCSCHHQKKKQMIKISEIHIIRAGHCSEMISSNSCDTLLSLARKQVPFTSKF